MIIRPFKNESILQNSMPKRFAGIAGKAVPYLIVLSTVLFPASGIGEDPAPSKAVTEFSIFQKANEHVQNKEYQKAIPLLEELLKAHPKDNTIKSFLARVYIANGNQLQSEGKLDQSLDMIVKSKKIIEEVSADKAAKAIRGEGQSDEERALSNLRQYFVGESGSGEAAITDSKAQVLLEKAAQSYKEKQYKLAKDLIKQALQLQPKNALAYELLGDCEYFSHNMTAAKGAYEQSFLNDANGRVKGKLEKIEKELQLESQFAEYADEHFLIRYKRSERFEGSEIREYLRDAYREVSRDFGHYLDYKTVVILYSKGEYETIANMPHWSGALYDGKIRIPIHDPKVDSRNLRKYIQHELTHVFIIDLSDNQCPTWLHEGVAQYEENKIIPIDMSLLKKAAKNDSLLPWEDLNQGITQAKDQASAILFYHQSFSMAKYMIEKYRFVKVKALLKEMAQETPIDEAFKKSLGVDRDGFYARWKKAAMAELV